MKELVEKIYTSNNLSDDELLTIIQTDEYDNSLFKMADMKRQEIYGKDVYIRGLVEFTNYCKNDCFYCGIRNSNSAVSRYRMMPEDIIRTCDEGYRMGFRTFVLQGGEDLYYTDDIICDIVHSIKNKFSDCAVTLSIGEKSRESYKAYKEAGADRYLLRHETASLGHYERLHPKEMSLENRKQCLYDLKELGYQVGAGFMVESPFQNPDDLICDLRFLQDLDPDMIGIGPFITQSETPFSKYKNGGLELTLRLISILRLMFPYALIPATTSLGTIHPDGRELGLKAGANVLMPNITPVEERKKYLLYDNKICIDEDATKCRECIDIRVSRIGYKIVTDIGNVKRHNK